MKIKNTFSKLLFERFTCEPTAGQRAVLDYLPRFLSGATGESVLLLRGYAGTGKTTLVSALVKSLRQVGQRSTLLAPTGRAAKVMAQYTGGKAHTIHRYIYNPTTVKGGAIRFVRQPNKASDTLFIVDEASMLSDCPVDSQGLQSDSLLHDLFSFVAEGRDCKLFLVGDAAQLPPVHLDRSPALDVSYLRSEFSQAVKSFELTQVVRQAQHSAVLYNASKVREKQADLEKSFQFDLSMGDELRRLQSRPVIHQALEANFTAALDDTVVIVSSNKRAVQYNLQIRNKIFHREAPLEPGDRIMVIKNNYHWLPEGARSGFIANGDVLCVERVISIEACYGLRFARVRLSLVDYPKEPKFTAMVCLDTLTSEKPALSYECSRKLYQQVKEVCSAENNKSKLQLALKNNPYLNALQVKFAYAITCHKAQGGQWPNVFLEQSHYAQGISYWRWLYTALTRTQDKLNLIRFSDPFFKADEETTR